jgi:NADPH:quinone reductase-like Zn-dependent oxidoreductase
MKAAHITKWCAQGTVPDTIEFGTIEAPRAPVKKEVLIDVKAAAINVDDVSGLQDTAAGGWGIHLRKPSATAPLVGGLEYAGVVVACGPDCTRVKVGDRVCGIQEYLKKSYPGTWAEQLLAPEDFVVPIPADCDISFVDLAAVPMGVLVAGDMYPSARLPTASGERCRCLVLGASGGLGTMMLQMLRRHEGGQLYIAAVCSSANVDKVRSLGADEAIDYKKGSIVEQLAGADKFDVVLDFVGGADTQRGAAPLLRRGGRFITAVGPVQNLGNHLLSCWEFTGLACGMTGRLLGGTLPCAKYKYILSADMPPLKANNIDAFVVKGGLRAEIGLEVPFAETPLRDALRRVASRHTGGKVVINMERTA